MIGKIFKPWWLIIPFDVLIFRCPRFRLDCDKLTIQLINLIYIIHIISSILPDFVNYIPISSEMVIFLPGHSSSLKIMIHSNFFAVGQTRYSCSFRFLCARLHTVIIRFLQLFRKNETAILLKTKVEMPHSVSTNRNQVSPEDEIGGNQRN